MRRFTFFLFIVFLWLMPPTLCRVQTKQPVPKSIVFADNPQPVADTVREFEIIRGPSMRMIQTDTGTLQTIAGGAIVQQDGTRFIADSIALNNDTKIMQSFGNVHINDGDTIHIYSQYLRYNGNDKYAYMSKNVKLTGKKGTLLTEELDYNLNSGIGNYYKGGKIINNKNIITSKRGTYYADTKDVYFKQDVKMDGPKDHIRSDSLIYNMNDGNITFVSDTYIKNKEAEIRTTEGRYDTNSGDAFFSSRTNVLDSSGRIYTANTMAMEGKSGNAQLEGNAIIIDSANGFTLLAGQVFLNKNENSFFATKKPVLIIQQKKDSTYIAADVIYSGLAKMVNNQLVYPSDSATLQSRQQSERIQDSEKDTSSVNTEPENLHDSTQAVLPDANLLDSVRMPKVLAKSDSLVLRDSTTLHIIRDSTHQAAIIDSTASPAQPPVQISGIDAGHTKPATQETRKKRRKRLTKNLPSPPDTAKIATPETKPDSMPAMPKTDTIPPPATDSSVINIPQIMPDSVGPRAVNDSSKKTNDSTRYFIAYHNVRIYNDSLQSVCDSLFISSADSVFRLYREPVLWSGTTQVTGDTMFLFTKNKEAERLYVFDRAMVVNKTREGFFNQMTGKTLNGYFTENKFDSIKIRGSQSETIYYLQDEDSAYVGVDRSAGDAINLFFNKGDLLRIVYINEVKGTTYPMNDFPEDQRELKGFQWLDKRRPKNKAELFQ